MGWVQYDTAVFINSPSGCEFIIDLSCISTVKYSPQACHGSISNNFVNQKNLYYWVTSVATGMKIGVLHFH